MEAKFHTRLIGRDIQLKFLKDKLLEDEVHLLQVYGQPCVGKSALIHEVRMNRHQSRKPIRFGLVSLFNGISIFVRYIMPMTCM